MERSEITGSWRVRLESLANGDFFGVSEKKNTLWLRWRWFRSRCRVKWEFKFCREKKVTMNPRRDT